MTYPLFEAWLRENVMAATLTTTLTVVENVKDRPIGKHNNEWIER